MRTVAPIFHPDSELVATRRKRGDIDTKGLIPRVLDERTFAPKEAECGGAYFDEAKIALNLRTAVKDGFNAEVIRKWRRLRWLIAQEVILKR